MADPILIPIIAVASAPIIALGLPIARALARRIDAQAAAPRVAPEVVARLEHMERAIDTIAIEIERISEAQRFTTRLLAEGRGVTPEPISGPGAYAAPQREVTHGR